MDVKWIELAREWRARRLETLRSISAPAAIIAAEEAAPLDELARRLEAEDAAQRPDVIAAFKAANPGYVQHPEDEEVWVLARARNQGEVDAWNAARAADLSALRGIEAAPGEIVTAPSGAQWQRLDTSIGWTDRLAVPFGEAWRRIAGPDCPERDFAPITIAEWWRAQQTPQASQETEAHDDRA